MDSTTTHFALPEKSSLGLRDQIGEIVQEVVALFFQPGHYDSHLRNKERRYKRRWHVMNDAIARHLGMLDRTPTRGDKSFWLSGPGGSDATELSNRLRDNGLLFCFVGTAILLDQSRFVRSGGVSASPYSLKSAGY